MDEHNVCEDSPEWHSRDVITQYLVKYLVKHLIYSFDHVNLTWNHASHNYFQSSIICDVRTEDR